MWSETGPASSRPPVGQPSALGPRSASPRPSAPGRPAFSPRPASLRSLVGSGLLIPGFRGPGVEDVTGLFRCPGDAFADEVEESGDVLEADGGRGTGAKH